MISRSKKFIFIHIPKAAGSSVADALLPYDDHPWLNHPMARKIRNRLGVGKVSAPGVGIELFRHHATAREVRAQLGPAEFDRYFSFAFVRNPWDFYVSYYHYVRKATLHPYHVQARMTDFSVFLKQLLDKGPMLQATRVSGDDGAQIVDFVGRYERLEEHFAEICERVGIQARLPHMNKTRRSTYREYYDGETQALVARLNRLDIETFGYEF